MNDRLPFLLEIALGGAAAYAFFWLLHRALVHYPRIGVPVLTALGFGVLLVGGSFFLGALCYGFVYVLSDQPPGPEPWVIGFLSTIAVLIIVRYQKRKPIR